MGDGVFVDYGLRRGRIGLGLEARGVGWLGVRFWSRCRHVARRLFGRLYRYLLFWPGIPRGGEAAGFGLLCVRGGRGGGGGFPQGWM